MQRSRRALLALASATLGASLAGCASTEPAQSTATEPVLELTGSVVAQSSAEEPARIAATLTNAGSGTVSVGFGPTLLFSDSGPGEELASPDPLVLDPDGHGVLRSEPVQAEDGCWRYPQDGIRRVQSSLEYRELAPGDELGEAYAVYTGTDAQSCLPAGSYRQQDIVETPEPIRTATLTLTIDIDGTQTLSVSGAATPLSEQSTQRTEPGE